VLGGIEKERKESERKGEERERGRERDGNRKKEGKDSNYVCKSSTNCY